MGIKNPGRALMLQVTGRKIKETIKKINFRQSLVFDLAIYSTLFRKINKPAKNAEIRHSAKPSITQRITIIPTTGIPNKILINPQANQLHPVLTIIRF